MVTLFDFCKETNNWFTWREDMLHDQSLADIFDAGLADGQYFRIVGSTFNDGVYQYDPISFSFKQEDTLFSIWKMKVPSQVIALLDEINEWETKYEKTLSGPYASESFNGYSRSIRTGSDGSNWTWKNQFETQLNGWRKV